MGLSWRRVRMALIAPRQVSFRRSLSNTLMSSVFMYFHVGVHSVSKISGQNKLSVSRLPFLPTCFQTSWSLRETVSGGRDTRALVTNSVPRVIFPILFRLLCLPWHSIWRCIHMGTPQADVHMYVHQLIHSRPCMFSLSSAHGKRSFSESQSLLAYSALSMRRMEMMG